MLLDSAIMPLVISGVPRVQSNLYDVCDFFVTTLVEDIDYIEEDKAVWLTPRVLSLPRASLAYPISTVKRILR